MNDIRIMLFAKKIPVWKVADAIGVSEMTIFRWLRKEDKEHREKILDAIKQIEDGEKE